MSLKPTFSRIKESYSERRQLPRLGKIRLGVKVEMQRPGQSSTQRPKETEHFVCPPEVEAVYGPEPTELDVMFPHDDPEVVFVQKLARYGSTAGLKCHGDGQNALRLNEQTRQWEPRSCPCEYRKTEQNLKGDCTEQSNLMVLLPTVSMGGVYQVTTRSYHSTVALNSSIDYIKALCGRISLIPLKLRRQAQVTHHAGKSQTHYTLNLILDANLKEIQAMRHNPDSIMIPAQYQIEGPVDENPILDPPDEVETVDAETLAALDDQQQQALSEKLTAAKAKLAEKRGDAPNGGGRPTPTPESETAQPAEPEPASDPHADLIDDGRWKRIITYLDSSLELRKVKDAAKKSMRAAMPDVNVDNLHFLVEPHVRGLFVMHLNERASTSKIELLLPE